LAPRTVARSHPNRLVLCRSGCPTNISKIATTPPHHGEVTGAYGHPARRWQARWPYAPGQVEATARPNRDHLNRQIIAAHVRPGGMFVRCGAVSPPAPP
jgi:hypothetical protein